MKRVIVESPYAAPTAEGIARNERYAKRAVMDCLHRGEAPIASHLLFPQAGLLREAEPAERKLGIEAGHAWLGVAEAVVFYVDHGMSTGMREALSKAIAAGIDCIERRLPPEKP